MGVRLFVCLFAIFLQVGCGGGGSSGSDGEQDESSEFKIVRTSPDEGLANIPINSQVEVQFNRELEGSTLNASTFWLLDQHSHQPVKATIHYDEINNTAHLIPTSLEYDRHYTMNIHHSIRDTSQKHLSKTQKFSFVTQIRPPIFSQNPEPNNTDVSTRATISVSYETDANINSITPQSFRLLASTGASIPATVTSTNRTSTLVPNSRLSVNTQYKVQLTTDIKQADGADMFSSVIEWDFSTRAIETSTIQFGEVGPDRFVDVEIDSKNNLIVAGSSIFNNGLAPEEFNTDAVIYKFDNKHELLKKTAFGSSEFDAVSDIVTDAQDNIYVLGYTDGSIDQQTIAIMSDVFLAKFDSAGNQLWITQFGSESGHELSSHMALMSNGDVIIAGATDNAFATQMSQGDHDVFIARYTSEGDRVWLKQFGQSGNDFAAQLQITSADQILLLMSSTVEGGGTPFSPPGIGSEVVTLERFDGNGSSLWRYVFEKEGAPTHPNGLAVLSDGTIAVTTFTFDFQKFPNPTISTLTLFSGDAVSESIPLNSDVSLVSSISVDANDQVYVLGLHEQFDAPTPDRFGNISVHPSVVKLDGMGTMLWKTDIPMNGDGEGHTEKLVIDSNGGLHVLGGAFGGVDGNSPIGGSDGFLATIDATTGNLK